MLRMRPVPGSTTTTLPGIVPNASAAARRTVRSSPSTLSPKVGSTGGGSLLKTGFLFLPVDTLRPGFLACVATPTFCNSPKSRHGARMSFFIRRYVTYQTNQVIIVYRDSSRQAILPDGPCHLWGIHSLPSASNKRNPSFSSAESAGSLKPKSSSKGDVPIVQTVSFDQ